MIIVKQKYSAKSLITKFRPLAPFILILVVAAALRFINLGYSDFQGDEIKALYNPAPGQSIAEYLFDQRKGPVQFLVTAALKPLNPDYSNQFLMRFPFAVAGFLAVFFFYKLVKFHFGEKVAFYSSFFFATNGFFIAFSRIVQYQSYVILFMVLALYMFSLKKYVWGFFFWALSILSHYDGIFIAPFAFILLIKDIRKKEFWAGVFVFVIMLAFFYVPFVFSISDATLSYWRGRVEGTGGKLSSSIYLFRVYQPIYMIHIYIGLTILGVLSSCALLLKGLSKNVKYIFLLLWFLCPLIFLELLVNIPGTHIYTYFVPLFIFVGVGVAFVETTIHRFKFIPGKLRNAAIYFGLFVAFAFTFAQSYQIYVDHKYEYPWENEKFLMFTFPRPSSHFHLSLFGFPYYRHWEEISEYVKTAPTNGYYSTNERDSISRHYVKIQKSGDWANLYVFIVNPQSFTIAVNSERITPLLKVNSPIKIYYDSM